MGRGRQKAKQTKVARELKYHSSDIDVTALQRELGGGPVRQPVSPPPPVEEEEDDPYAAYAARYGALDDDDESDQLATRRRA
ncbi:DUF3073 domain-containing protein [Nakamurella leprariae]|uniref:DUF3073 domain-containing protein n=1 Tax=Nakamurella leprariae TaxID=2803911 RepID=A0A939BYH2_9ACTN|nr:DUF3073 domain-containing protein [Nakamurella leprariae]MBM9466616.1 DUF3073 domain-containing protein [Nakamurella leprariae]